MAGPSLALRGPARTPAREILHAGQIGQVWFGETPASVVQGLNQLLRHRPTQHYHSVAGCNVDHAISWPGLAVFFQQGRFVGYSYRPANGASRVPTLATARGLRVGDTLDVGRRLYGPAFHATGRGGGSWWVSTPQGRVEGFASGWAGGPRGSVATIAAGQVGCPATTP